MAKKPQISDVVLDAAMDAAIRLGWRNLTLSMIAEASGQPLDVVVGQYSSKSAILSAFVKRIDRAMVAGNLDDLKDEPVRERLFDLLMRRFDAMAPFKEALRSILRERPMAPDLVCLAPRLGCSMALVLDVAGVSTSGILGSVRTKGLSLIYLSVFRTWLNDDSEDLGPTMAKLSKALERADSLASGMCRRRRNKNPGPSDVSVDQAPEPAG